MLRYELSLGEAGHLNTCMLHRAPTTHHAGMLILLALPVEIFAGNVEQESRSNFTNDGNARVSSWNRMTSRD